MISVEVSARNQLSRKLHRQNLGGKSWLFSIFLQDHLEQLNPQGTKKIRLGIGWGEINIEVAQINIACIYPENGWLEYYFPIGATLVSGRVPPTQDATTAATIPSWYSHPP